MIVHALTRLQEIKSVLPHADRVLRFLADTELNQIETGRVDIQGDDVYAMIIRDPARRPEDGQLEVHRRYLDIQILLAGQERIGWRDLGTCANPLAYDQDADLQFLEDEPQVWVDLLPKQFALFLPSDAHLPMVGDGPLEKAVIKVKVR